MVAGFRIFRQYLEQYQEYSRAGLEHHQADSGRCGKCAETGHPEHLLCTFPVHFTDLEHTEKYSLEYLERHQDHGSEYRHRIKGRGGQCL